MSTRTFRQYVLLLLLLLPALSRAHNWLHMRSRVGKLSTVIPAPPKANYHRPVVQVGANQEFGVQFVNGHPGSYYYFAILHADDTSHLADHTEQLLQDYINSAPANASDRYASEVFRKVRNTSTWTPRCSAGPSSRLTPAPKRRAFTPHTPPPPRPPPRCELPRCQ